MSIPSFQECMLPILSFLNDKNEHTNSEIVTHISDFFQLSDDERNERIPSGLQNLIYSRVYWAKTYLKKALLIEEPAKSINIITLRGVEVINQHPDKVDVKFLLRYKEFKDYKYPNKKMDKESVLEETLPNTIEKTPIETIFEGVNRYQANIKDDLLDLVKKNTPGFFEKLVVELITLPTI